MSCSAATTDTSTSTACGARLNRIPGPLRELTRRVLQTGGVFCPRVRQEDSPSAPISWPLPRRKPCTVDTTSIGGIRMRW